MNLTEREILARTLQAEAGNQGFDGMIAAGSVIMNRVGAGFGSNIRDVIMKPGQFSAWNSTTKYADGEQGQNMNFTPNADAYKAADALLSGKYEDITGGATHYYNPKISQPDWGMAAGGAWKQIGDHVFGKAGPGNRTQRGTQTMDRQQPTAQQMQQMQQMQQTQQRPSEGGLMGFLRDPRNRQVFSALSRSRAGQALGKIADADMARQEIKSQDNRTAEWLATQPNGEKYAQAIRQGALSGKQAYEQYIAEGQRSTVTVDGVVIDKNTGEVIYKGETLGNLSKEQVGVVAQLNGQLQKVYKPYDEIYNGYNLIKSAIARKQQGDISSGIDDLTVTIAFAKILDPESVVRSEESDAVAKAGGGIEAALNAFKNFMSGEGTLGDDVRQRIFTVAQNTAQTWYTKAKNEYDRIMRTADAYGIPRDVAEKVVSPPRPLSIAPIPTENGNNDTTDKTPPKDTRTQKAIDADVTLDQWNAMTDADKKAFQ